MQTCGCDRLALKHQSSPRSHLLWEVEMEDYSTGGVTLRSLLEKRNLLVHQHEEITGKEYKASGDPYTDAAAAFLGPNLWDKTLSDFKLEYLDLDEFLGTSNNNHNNANNAERGNKMNHRIMENNVPPCSMGNIVPNPVSHNYQGPVDSYHAPQPSCSQPLIVTPPSSPIRASSCSMQVVAVQRERFSPDCKFSTKDLALATPPGEDNFDPSSIVLPQEDLKPQPIVKKSRKHFVPDDLKDDRYWARRHKNNLAAKRSREARRIKENQIVLRASYLEKENNNLKEDVMRLKAENDMLRNQLKKLHH